MIKLTDVNKIYDNNVYAIKNINVSINKGEFVFLVGSSGSGKSSFIKMLLKEVEPTNGEIIVDGTKLNDLKEKEIPYFRRKLGVVFQDFRLLSDKTVYENVAYAMKVIEQSPKRIRQRVPKVLSAVGLAHNMYPNELSGGQKQRVAIARALATNPSIILADEPTGALDSATGRLVMDLFHKVHEEQGKTIVFITHNNELADETERIITLKDGNIISEEDNKRYFKRFGNGEVSCL